MNSNNSTSTPVEAVLQQNDFLERVVRYQDGSLDGDQCALLEAELASDPNKQRAFAEMQLRAASINHAFQKEAFSSETSSLASATKQNHQSRFWAFALLVTAASLLVVVFGKNRTAVDERNEGAVAIDTVVVRQEEPHLQSLPRNDGRRVDNGVVKLTSLPLASDASLSILWEFEAEETTPLKSVGGVHRDVPGPRAPDYPDFDENNTAIKLDGNGARLEYEDNGPNSRFDFTNGDTISLEAWVQVDDLRSGENVYVVGKGRTGSDGFPNDNQNWALRIRENKGKAGLSFLFATPPASGMKRSDSHWHRWTTKEGFTPGPGWHHVAVTYQFGKPETIRGWIDGKPRDGSWDMGGQTTDAPVVDDDAVWIGSSRRGAAGNSFRGCLDSIAVHRKALDDLLVATRYRSNRVEVEKSPEAKPAPEVMPLVEGVERGKVLLTLHEGMPTHGRWLNEGEVEPKESMRLALDSMLLDRLPLRHDEWGIRDGWKVPVLTRLSSDVSLNPGTHKFMMRVRGLSRLWVDGKLVAKGQAMKSSPSGEEPMTPVAEPPKPGLRRAEHRQQEVFAEVVIATPGVYRVVLETLVGGKGHRADPGETCVAVQTDPSADYYLVSGASNSPPVALSSGRGVEERRSLPAGSEAVPLTDVAVEAALIRLENYLRDFDDRNRRAAASSQDSYWNERHALARKFVTEKSESLGKATHETPLTSDSSPRRDGRGGESVADSSNKGSSHPIDSFIQAKIARAVAEAAKSTESESKHFHTEVLPILRDNCFRCHSDKAQGGLRLDSREAIVGSGDSETPAVVPGEPMESEVLRRIRSSDEDERMPPGGAGLSSQQINVVEAWIKSGAAWPAPLVPANTAVMPDVLSDEAFLRRVTLDVIGLPPTESEVRSFLADKRPNKRELTIDRLLADERWADHMMSYWQDVLAENPTLINSSLNTTGPFRWFLYDAFRDNKSFDRLVTELILLRGSAHEGGSAGFGIAGDNDAPFAAKGQIIGTAFLGVELQCARCHDSPYHSTKQRDLYALSAMLERKTIKVPKTSRVPVAFFEKKVRESLIKVTLKPDDPIEPTWPFGDVTNVEDDESLDKFLQNANDSRERLAALVTSPANDRFSQVVANRIWRRFIGAGIVEPPHDWEGNAPSHPELLRWLADDFMAHGYDLKHLMKRILTSQLYQRPANGNNREASADQRYFATPDRRRMTAEQIVDAFFAASGQSIDVEELTFDPDGRREAKNRLTLGRPSRAWMFCNLANERDRPSLALPKARTVTDVMEAFGWSGARQNPRTDRETSPNVLQPGVLANSSLSLALTRLASGSELSKLAFEASSPVQLIDSLFLRFLSRIPTEAEREPLVKALSIGFNDRIVLTAEMEKPSEPTLLPKVTWSNHLQSEANSIALELELRARKGPPAETSLHPAWREAAEDVVWSIVNTREFVWMP